MNNSIIIGVDTGNRCIKTANNVFVSGIKKFSGEMPFQKGILNYNNANYMLSQRRVRYLQDKTESDEYFVLTLFAILKELESRNLLTEDVIPISLGVGLPPSHLTRLKNKFRDYFLRNTVEFLYDNRKYTFDIQNVTVFSQGYAAIYMDFENISAHSKSYIIDIGGYTTDIISLNNGIIDPEFYESLDLGVIELYNKIISEIAKKYGRSPSESQIDEVIRTGKEISSVISIYEIVNTECQKYVSEIIRVLTELGIDLQFSKGIFVGGGAERLSPWIKKSQYIFEPYFINNINANAQGYEACLKSLLEL